MKPLSDIFESNLKQCADLQPEESVLVMSDFRQAPEISMAVVKAIEKLGGKSLLIVMEKDLLKQKSMPESYQQIMNESDLIVLCTSDYFPGGSRVIAAKAGARVLSMVKADESMIRRCIDIDYDELSTLTRKVADRFSEAKEVEIKSDAGTDIHFTLSGNKAFYFDGLCRQKGKITSHPSGVVAVPLEEKQAEGTWIIDASAAQLGLVLSPIKVEVTEGVASIVSDSEQSDQFRKILSEGDNNSLKICEVGCGTNAKATYIGELIEDERVQGSAHIGFGGNTHFGGNIQSVTHIDTATRNPTVTLDGIEIITKGKLNL
ncbi:MAG: aminopeptidase [Candidatus Hodarchaeales archaeon]|jgi:leucyl aminopeptidase (aminopeptidase T)